jgi:hypothetical protein
MNKVAGQEAGVTLATKVNGKRIRFLKKSIKGSFPTRRVGMFIETIVL